MNFVLFATGARSDYGIVTNYLNILSRQTDVCLKLLVTGAHLDERYGNTIDIIKNDGFDIELEVNLNLNDSSSGITNSIAIAIDKFGEYFSRKRPDLLIVLGDRYEMLGVTIAAAINKVKILHIHGGENTFGNYDEFIRHSITKMSDYHITSTEEYRNRVIQLGEHPNNVFNCGSLGALNCKDIKYSNVSNQIIEIAKKKPITVLFHPETLTDVSVDIQVKELLVALDCFNDEQFVFIGINADTAGQLIKRIIVRHVEEHDNAIYIENLSRDSYHYLLKNSKCLLGNSSSGIIEAPTLEILTINIGDRQKGRTQGDSIINVPCNSKYIVAAINNLEKTCSRFLNPYFKQEALTEYVKVTNDILSIDRNIKEFYDIMLIE